MYYESLEPFGAVRDDWRAAYILAVIANMVRGKKQKPFNPMDFAPDSVVGWFRAIQEAGPKKDGSAQGRAREATNVPSHPSMAIFEDMIQDHVDHSPA